MNIPVFKHTIASLRAVIGNDNEPLQNVSRLIKYDPGLYFSLIQFINASGMKTDVSTASQAVSLMGAERIEKFILRQDNFLADDYFLLWCYAVIAGCAAERINDRIGICNSEEAFFGGMLPSMGILLILMQGAHYSDVQDILLKIPAEDKLFIEDRLFKTDYLEQLSDQCKTPKLYSDSIGIMSSIFSKEGIRMSHLEHPARFSGAYQAFQLFQITEAAAAAARVILFPFLVEAQEKFRELSKRYFRIPENEIEELLALVMEDFESICTELEIQDAAREILESTEYITLYPLIFSTNSKTLNDAMESIYISIREERNIFVYGEPGAGKRLFAVALHRRPDNPRLFKPFLSYYCSALDSETLEMELFGTKGGFLGLEKHKGALEMADGGTVMLKDIDAIPLPLQERLAEIFCRDEFYKIGETRPASFNIRFLLTSRLDIVVEAKEGRFSKKLLDVLNPSCIYIPPLRERREDIEIIAENIIRKYNLQLDDPALRLGLKEYYDKDPFPGNLKSLKRLLFFLSAKRRLKT